MDILTLLVCGTGNGKASLDSLSDILKGFTSLTPVQDISTILEAQMPVISAKPRLYFDSHLWCFLLLFLLKWIVAQFFSPIGCKWFLIYYNNFESLNLAAIQIQTWKEIKYMLNWAYFQEPYIFCFWHNLNSQISVLNNNY